MTDLLQKTCQCRSVTYDELDKLQCISQSKYSSVLCHKSIDDIAIFHSIKGKALYSPVLCHELTRTKRRYVILLVFTRKPTGFQLVLVFTCL